MARVAIFTVVLVLVVCLALARLWTWGMPLRTLLKMAIFFAGLVVSIKMVLGGYLALQGDTAGWINVVGFYGALVLVPLFAWATFSEWRRGAVR